MHGWRGGLFAGLAFVAPGAALMLVLAAAYVLAGGLPSVLLEARASPVSDTAQRDAQLAYLENNKEGMRYAEFQARGLFIGSGVVGGASRAWSDMRIHSDGFMRILVRDCSLSESQAGRLTKRILDINCYRAMALLGFPLAREVTPTLGEADRRLALLASRMASRGTSADPSFESDLLADLTSLAAEIEAISARTTYRFDASRAYYGMVQQRLEQLRQQRIEGLQTFTEFLDARLAPAIATCESTQHRQTCLLYTSPSPRD